MNLLLPAPSRRNTLRALVALLAGSAMLASAAPPVKPTAAPTESDQLKSLSLADLGNVKITTVAKQPEEVWSTPAAVTVLTSDDIRRLGVTSIPELLRLVPGMDVARMQADQWAVAVRGFNSQFSRDLLLLIDGRSVYTPLFEGVYWDVQDLPLENIDRIEIIRGPGGTIWGANAVNGVINIITKHSADTQGEMVEATGAGTVTRFAGDIGYGFGLRPNMKMRVFGKEFNYGAEANPNHDPYDDSHQGRGGFRFDWKADTHNTLTATGMIYAGRTGDQNAIGEYYPPTQAIVDGHQIVSGGDLVVRWDHQQTGGSSFYAQAYYDRTNRATSQFTEHRDTFDLDLNEHIANLSRQDITLGAGLRESPSNLVQTQATVNFAPHRFNNYIYSFFAQDALSLIPNKLIFTAGSKFIDDAYSGWGVQPSAELLWRPAEHSTLWGSVARALQTPGRLDRDLDLIGYANESLLGYPLFVQIEGNPNFQPTVLIGWSAGYRQLLWQKLYVDVTAFHNNYDNVESYGGPAPLLSFPTTPYPITMLTEQYANGLRGITDGLELAPDWKPFSWLELRGSFSHLQMKMHTKAGYSSQTSYAYSDDGSSPHREASAQMILSLPHNFELVPDYRFVSALPAISIRAYQTADAHISWHHGNHFHAAVTGRNLLQPQHQEFTGDNGNAVGIRRETYASLGWDW